MSARTRGIRSLIRSGVRFENDADLVAAYERQTRTVGRMKLHTALKRAGLNPRSPMRGARKEQRQTKRPGLRSRILKSLEGFLSRRAPVGRVQVRAQERRTRLNTLRDAGVSRKEARARVYKGGRRAV